MIQKKLIGYRPNYPRKILQGAALTAAALVAMGGAAGCRNLMTPGAPMMPQPTQRELVLDGETTIAEPTEEPMLHTEGLVPMVTDEPDLAGDVAIIEPTDEPMLMGKIAVTEPPEEELVLDGDVCIPEPTKNPMEQPIMPSGLPLMPTPGPSDTPEI